MKEAGYKYAYDYDKGITDMQCMPNNLKDKIYYKSNDSREEKNLKYALT